MGKSKKPTILHLDNPDAGVQEIMLLEARLKALEEYGEEYISDRDKKNGYDIKELKKMALKEIAHHYQQRMMLIKYRGDEGLTEWEGNQNLSADEVWQELHTKTQQTHTKIKKMMNEDAEPIPTPVGQNITQETTGGDICRAPAK